MTTACRVSPIRIATRNLRDQSLVLLEEGPERFVLARDFHPNECAQDTDLILPELVDPTVACLAAELLVKLEVDLGELAPVIMFRGITQLLEALPKSCESRLGSGLTQKSCGFTFERRPELVNLTDVIGR